MTIPGGGIGPAAGAQPLRHRALEIAASGMSVQRQRMETIATNIANAETTRTEGGGPYRRRVVQVSAGDESPGLAAPRPVTGRNGILVSGPAAELQQGARVTGIVEDPSEGPRIYEPGHPDADADGYVRYPNVSVTQETVDMMGARRLFEANAMAFQAVKAMLRRAIDI